MKFELYPQIFFYEFRDFLYKCTTTDDKWGGNLRVLRDNYVIFGINFALMGVSSNDGKQLAHFRRFWRASQVDICAPRGVFTLMAANWPLMSVNVFWAMGAMSVNGLATA